MNKSGYRRKNYFIKKKLQLKITLSIVLTLLSVMLITGIGVYMGMWVSIIENFSSFKVSQNLENAKRIADYENARYGKGDFRLEKIFRQAELLSAQEKAALRNALQSVNKSLIPRLFIVVILIFLGGILLSHKVAGPLYRFERSARAIKEGNLRASFRIRKGDELQDTARALDEMAKSLRHDIEKIKDGVARLKEEVRALRGSVDPGKESMIRSTISEIDEILLKYNL